MITKMMAGDAGPVTGGGRLRVSKMGKLRDKGKLGKFVSLSTVYRDGHGLSPL